jgi:hypothetical protein
VNWNEKGDKDEIKSEMKGICFFESSPYFAYKEMEWK